jgi:hypothetical protein
MSARLRVRRKSLVSTPQRAMTSIPTAIPSTNVFSLDDRKLSRTCDSFWPMLSKNPVFRLAARWAVAFQLSEPTGIEGNAVQLKLGRRREFRQMTRAVGLGAQHIDSLHGRLPEPSPNVPLQYFVMRACRKSVAVHVTPSLQSRSLPAGKGRAVTCFAAGAVALGRSGCLSIL